MSKLCKNVISDKILIIDAKIARRRNKAIYLILGIVAHWIYTLVQRKRSQPESTPPNPTGNYSNLNSLSPIKAENDLDKQPAYGL